MDDGQTITLYACSGHKVTNRAMLDADYCKSLRKGFRCQSVFDKCDWHILDQLENEIAIRV